MDVNRTVRLELAIERLEVEGLPAGNSFALKLGIERELSRLVAERGTPAAWLQDSSMDVLALPAITFDAQTGESGLATSIARALYDGLSG